MAEDIVQDTFLKIWIRRDQLTKIDHFKAYIYRVAHNGLLSGIRRKALEATILAGSQPTTIIEPDLEEKLHFKQVKQVLQAAIENLPAQQKTAYQLRREEGLRIREIARIMNISEITVKRHLTSAQKRLRETLEDAFPFDIGILLIIFGLVYR